MGIDEYKGLVIEHFKSGKATSEQWDEMATAVLHLSESDDTEIDSIDTAILGKRVECPECGSLYRPKESCWGCGWTD